MRPFTFCLPEDVLHELFLLIRYSLGFPGEYEDLDTSHGGDDLPLWSSLIVASHVSRQWRQVALDSSRLWSFIRITGTAANRSMIHEFLIRSRASPLSILLIRSTNPASGYRNATSTVEYRIQLAVRSISMHQGDRFEQLGVHLSAGRLESDTTAMVLWLGKLSIPGLKKLWIEPSMAGIRDWPRHTHVIPDYDLSSIRDLHVVRIIPTAWFTLRDLTTFEIFDLLTVFTLEELIPVFSRSPSLETLKLRILYPGTLDEEDELDDALPLEEVEHTSPVVLPKLRHLFLAQDSRHTLSLLSNISFPLTTIVDIRIAANWHPAVDGSKMDVDPFWKHPALCALAASVSTATLVVDEWDVVFRSERLNLEFRFPPPIVLSYRGPPRTQRPSFWLCKGLAGMAYPSLTTLSLDLRSQRLSKKQTDLVFDTFPSVTDLSISIHPTKARTTLLGLTSLKDADDATSVRCPAARRFMFRWRSGAAFKDETSVINFFRTGREVAGKVVERADTAYLPNTILSDVATRTGIPY